MEACLLFAMVWAVGGTVDAAGRAAVSTHLRNFLKGELSFPSVSLPCFLYLCSLYL